METHDMQNLPEKIEITQEQRAKYEEFRQVASLLAFDIEIQWGVTEDSNGFEELLKSLEAEENEEPQSKKEEEMSEEVGFWFEAAKSLLWQLRELKENRDNYINDEKKRQQQFGAGQLINLAIASGQVRVDKIG